MVNELLTKEQKVKFSESKSRLDFQNGFGGSNDSTPFKACVSKKVDIKPLEGLNGQDSYSAAEQPFDQRNAVSPMNSKNTMFGKPLQQVECDESLRDKPKASEALAAHYA